MRSVLFFSCFLTTAFAATTPVVLWHGMGMIIFIAFSFPRARFKMNVKRDDKNVDNSYSINISIQGRIC